MMQTSVRDIHRQAMEIADSAFDFKRSGDEPAAQELFRRAFSLESQAAYSAIAENAAEPTRSVLLRSAATLAYHGDDLRESERLICLALSGEPPLEIAEELRELYEQVNAKRHLSMRSLSLAS
jgi:hypothetical protein